MATTKLFTIEDLQQMEPDDGRYELIRGVLRRMSPASGEHGEIKVEFTFHLRTFAGRFGGKVYPADVGFFLYRILIQG